MIGERTNARPELGWAFGYVQRPRWRPRDRRHQTVNTSLAERGRENSRAVGEN